MGLDKNKHKAAMVKVLKEIYFDTELSGLLGFKGGSAAMFFYKLPRFSVDLDFDLLDETKKDLVLKKIAAFLPKYGQVMEATEKRYTLFFLVSYEKGERQLKIEISKRPVKNKYVLDNYLGISAKVEDKKDMLAGKLSAFLTRKKFASRDLFDLWFFMEGGWEINRESVKEQTGLDYKSALKKALKMISKLGNDQLLPGFGELVDDKQKNWVKDKLLKETTFLINLYLEKEVKWEDAKV